MTDLPARLSAALTGRYVIGEQIGRGGMATVYSATDLKHNRAVAIKVLRPELAAALGTERFLREIQVAARLRHPHIIPLFDSGEIPAMGSDPPVLYYIMPQVEGESLRELIDREGPLPVPMAVKIAIEVADALERAHREGVIHRDIKPGNILLEGGHALVADFGISRALGALRDQGPASGQLTETGLAMGTPAYMSPEQIEGRSDIDGKSDIYSLGCVLFEMLTGSAPYTGTTPTAVAARHFMDPVPQVRQARPEVPPAVERVIAKSMTKSPRDRFATAGEFGAALREGESGATPTLMPPRARTLGLVGLVLLLLAGAYGLYRWSRADGAMPSNSTLAILPFSVRGPDTLDLGAGMVTLLSTKLDGAGDLRTVDARALLSYLERENLGGLDPARARRIAQHFSAGMFVLGEIVALGPRIQVTARLYDARGTMSPASEEGDLANLFEMVDRLAAKLLAQRAGEAGGLERLAGVSTTSLPAFKAYLDGESAMRTGRFDEAVEAYRRAIAADSNFALAWYRISVAAQWLTQDDVVREAGLRAKRLSTQLPDRVRQLLDATIAGNQGDLETAERMYRGITGTYPDDVEAWMQLAELLFHMGPANGRDVRESLEPWHRVIAYEPDNLIPLVHLARIAAANRDTIMLDTLVAKVRSIRSRSGQTTAAARAEELELAMLQAVVHHDAAAIGRISDSLGRGTSLTIAITIFDVAGFAENLDAGVKLTELITSESRNPAVRSKGYIIRAALLLGQGRLRAADLALDSAAQFDRGLATAFRAFARTTPFLSLAPESLAVERRRLDQIQPPSMVTPADVSAQFAIRQQLYPYYRHYLEGLFAALAQDYPAADRAAATLESLSGSPEELKLANNLAVGVRAEAALRQGQADEALRHLERVDVRIPYLLRLTPFYSGSRQHYRRAELLEGMGRLDEALRWYSSLDDQSYYDAPYLAASLLKRAQINERLERKEEAQVLYRRAIGLWHDPDPEIEHLAREAREGLDRSSKLP